MNISRIRVLALAGSAAALAATVPAFADSTAIAVTAADVTTYPNTNGRGFNYTQGSYVLGFAFRANSSISVTSLGYYDSTGTTGSTGPFGSHAVGLYDLSQNALLASGTVTAANPLSDVFRYVQISPIPLNLTDTYAIVGVTGASSYLVGVNVSAAPVDPALTYVSGADYPSQSGVLRQPTDFSAGNIFGRTPPVGNLADFGPNFQFSPTVPDLVVGPTTVDVADTNPANGTIYNDHITYQVASPPPAGTLGANGLYHYQYVLGYQGSPTLVLPLHNAGDVVNLSAGVLSPYNSLSGDLQSDFGTSYGSAVSVKLPFSADLTSFPISFDSIYAPTQVTIALIDNTGIIRLVDPPIPNGPITATGVPEPTSMALMGSALGLLAHVRKRRRSGE